MSDNPHESPQARESSRPKVVDYSPLLLRGLIALQLVWVAITGAMARGWLPEAFSVMGFAIPMMMLGAPAVALYLASDLGRQKLLLVTVVEVALFGLQFLALLPAVQ
jgi:hypothetical protein